MDIVISVLTYLFGKKNLYIIRKSLCSGGSLGKICLLLLQGPCILVVTMKKISLSLHIASFKGDAHVVGVCVARSKEVKQCDNTRSQQLVLFYLCICIVRFYMIKLFHKVAVMKL